MLIKENFVSIISPIFNEEAVIEEFVNRVIEVMAQQKVDYEIILIDDGSKDKTFDILRKLKMEKSVRLQILRFARNFGHQAAITAGMQIARGEAVIVLDCDLQDPPELLSEFIAEWRAGYQIVCGKRTQRKGETFFKRVTACLFYKLLSLTAKMDVLENVGDFYLLDRQVVDAINSMKERHRFIRGLIAWTGFKRIEIPYIREARFAGESKYNLMGMLKFSFDGITAFTFFPLRLIALLGFFISGLSFFGILIIIFQKIFTNTTIIGWPSTMVTILFIGGIQILAIGVIGEYIARIGDDVKSRPLYLISEHLD